MEVRQALAAENGERLASLYSSGYKENNLQSPFDTIFSGLKNTFNEQATLAKDFIKHFGTSQNSFEIPLLKQILHRLYTLSNENSEESARIISKAFTIAVTDRTLSKRPALVFIMNLLFRIYFKLNNIRLCQNMIKATTNLNIQDYPISEEVTFRFYRGRVHIFDGEYKEAENTLQIAFEKCPKRNKRLILSFLIVLKVFHGQMPTTQLLEKYNLHSQYSILLQSVKQGNICQFEEQLNLNRKYFIKLELFLLISLKMKNLMIRNLLKRVYLCMGISNRLFFRDLKIAFAFVQNPIEIAEIECICANLICEGFIKGYISHEKQLIVLSKLNPFPSPSSFL